MYADINLGKCWVTVFKLICFETVRQPSMEHMGFQKIWPGCECAVAAGTFVMTRSSWKNDMYFVEMYVRLLLLMFSSVCCINMYLMFFMCLNWRMFYLVCAFVGRFGSILWSLLNHFGITLDHFWCLVEIWGWFGETLAIVWCKLKFLNAPW